MITDERLIKEFCDKLNSCSWDDQMASIIARKNKIPKKYVYDLAKDYAKDRNILTKDEIQKRRSSIRKLKRDQKLAYAYNICEYYGWDTSKIETESKRIGLSVASFKVLADEYAKKHLNMSEEELKTKKLKAYQDLRLKKIKYAYMICQEYGWFSIKVKEESKREEIKEEAFRNRAIKYAKEYLNMSMQDIEKLKSAKRKENKIEIFENSKEYQKFCYMLLQIYNGDKEKILLFAEGIGKDANSIIKEAEKYIEENPSAIEIDKNSRTALIFNLIVANSNEEIIKLFNEARGDLKPQEILKRLSLEIYNLTRKYKLESIKPLLDKKIAIYKKYLTSERENNVSLRRILRKNQYADYIIDYINSGLTIEQFIAKNNINKDKFREYILSIKNEENNELYKLFKSTLIKERSFAERENINIAKRIIYFIINGVYDNGVKRDFTIYDYAIITDKPLTLLIKVTNDSSFSNEERKALKIFASKNSSYGSSGVIDSYICNSNEKVVASGTYYIRKKDKDGKLTNEREMLPKEKQQQLIEHIKLNCKLKLTNKLFISALRLYESDVIYALNEDYYQEQYKVKNR